MINKWWMTRNKRQQHPLKERQHIYETLVHKKRLLMIFLLRSRMQTMINDMNLLTCVLGMKSTFVYTETDVDWMWKEQEKCLCVRARIFLLFNSIDLELFWSNKSVNNIFNGVSSSLKHFNRLQAVQTAIDISDYSFSTERSMASNFSVDQSTQKGKLTFEEKTMKKHKMWNELSLWSFDIRFWQQKKTKSFHLTETKPNRRPNNEFDEWLNIPRVMSVSVRFQSKWQSYCTSDDPKCSKKTQWKLNTFQSQTPQLFVQSIQFAFICECEWPFTKSMLKFEIFVHLISATKTIEFLIVWFLFEYSRLLFICCWPITRTFDNFIVVSPLDNSTLSRTRKTKILFWKKIAQNLGVKRQQHAHTRAHQIENA